GRGGDPAVSRQTDIRGKPGQAREKALEIFLLLGREFDVRRGRRNTRRVGRCHVGAGIGSMPVFVSSSFPSIVRNSALCFEVVGQTLTRRTALNFNSGWSEIGSP